MVRTRETILLLGDPRLRRVCDPVDCRNPEFPADSERLLAALEQFRSEYGFGRAIAAPQIGIPRRMIAMNLGAAPFLLINPELSLRSAEQFTLWDDCMSFPWIMVKVARHTGVDLNFLDSEGNPQEWKRVEPAISELLQHEIDHLDGVLAVDRALDRDSMIARDLYCARRDYFKAQVDYAIQATVQPGS